MNFVYSAMIGLILCGLTQQAASAAPFPCTERLHYTEWTQLYFASADAVFLGKIVAEATPDQCVPPASPTQPGSDPATSMDELLEKIEASMAANARYCGSRPARLQEATFEVDKSWKGLVGPTITVNANLYVNDLGEHPLTRGESYLVFAFENDDDTTLQVPVACASHRRAKDTDSKIRVLDALTRKRESR